MKRLALLVPLMITIIFGYSTFQNSAQGVQWKVEYFNNPYLMSPVTSTQYVNLLALNWGGSAPATNVGADRFSARISSDVYFPAGTYRFYLLTDDRAHMYLDFQSQINNWDNNKVGQILTRDITLPSGTFHIQIDFREEEGNAYVFLDWENTADGIQGPNFQIPAGASGSGAWSAEYFSNTTLSGPAFAVFNENSPSHNWGIGAPLAGMPADNFSVRWTSTQSFDGSPYQISVRADDGVRVFVDNVQYINQWNLATAQTYTATITPSAGNHTVRVEFYEAGGIASIDFTLARTTTTPTNPGTVNQTGAYLVVNTGRLNVRSLPTVYGSTIVAKINQGASYPIVGINSARSWWKINVNNVTGWVSAPYVIAYNTTNVPVADSSTSTVTLPLTGYKVTTIANVNMRSGPSLSASRVGIIPASVAADVIARNASASWWYVRYGGINGWVSATYAPIQYGANILTVPILG